MNKITVLRFEPTKDGVIVSIEDSLPALKDELGGFAKPHYITSKLIALVNEDGRKKGLRPNRSNKGNVLFGTIIVCRENDECLESIRFGDVVTVNSALIKI